jgi:hypothetical protein
MHKPYQSTVLLLALVFALVSAVAPPRAALAADILWLSNFGMVILNPPAGGEVAISLDNVVRGARFVRFRVDWATADTRTQQLQINGVPGAPIQGFDLNSSIFQPQPRDSDQIILNVQPPARSFNATFMVELAGGFVPGQTIGQIVIKDLTLDTQVARNTIPLVLDPRVTSGTVDLTNGGTQTGGLALNSGALLTGGNGAGVAGSVTALPGSTVQVTQGQMTLGDPASSVDLRGLVSVSPGATLELQSSGPAQLGGQTEVTHGTIKAGSGVLIGTSSTALASADLETALILMAIDREALLETEIKAQIDAIKQQNTELARLNELLAATTDPAQRAVLQQQIDTLSASQQLEMIRLQSMVNKRTQAFEMMWNLVTSVQGVRDSIVANMRSTFDGDVDVVGTLQIGGPFEIGHTNATGDLTVRTGAQLAVEAFGLGTGQFDTITVAGNADFEVGAIITFGLLDPSDPAGGSNPFVPALFDTFDIVTAAGITSNGIVVEAPSFADRTIVASIYDNAGGTQTLRLTVIPLLPPLVITGPASATYGTQFAPTVAGGSGGGTLSFAVVPGSTACALLTSGPDAGKIAISSGSGTCAITATASADADSSITSAQFDVTVGPAAQSISFAPNTPTSKTTADQPFTVSAVATSGLPVSFAAATGSSCSVSNAGLVGNLAAGTCTIVASQAGDGNYLQAPAVQHQVTISATGSTALDDFNRANGAVGAAWSGATGTGFYRIAGNRLEARLGGPLIWRESFGANQHAFVTLSTIDSRSPSQGVLLKVQGGSTTDAGAIAVVYDALARAVRVSTLRLGDRSWTLYRAQAVTFAAGDVLGARVLANGTVEITRNGTLITRVTLSTADQTFFNTKGGKIGVWTVAAPRAVFDDFGGGTIAP